MESIAKRSSVFNMHGCFLRVLSLEVIMLINSALNSPLFSFGGIYIKLHDVSFWSKCHTLGILYEVVMDNSLRTQLATFSQVFSLARVFPFWINASSAFLLSKTLIISSANR